MRLFLAMALAALGPLTLPAGPSDMNASRIPDRRPIVRSGHTNAPLLTDEQVRSWVRKWQRRLGLEEWVIEARIVRIWDLPQGAVANIHWSLPKRKATIKVLNSADSNLAPGEIPRDTELSVVHELVHLSMARLPLDPNHTELEEETVKRISAALLDLQDRNEPAAARR
ncbi:MAG TPA: hypothetical protein VFL57_01300 [Bryobacteraceae bacterium]|nr:hypothetical protein [Bryobacteraceae bacterium]